MKTERERFFRSLHPPPGGPARFQSRLNAGRSRVAAGMLPLAAAAAALTLAVTAALWPGAQDRGIESPSTPPSAIYNAPEFDRLLGRPLTPTDLTVTRDEQALNVVELSSADGIRVLQIN